MNEMRYYLLSFLILVSVRVFAQQAQTENMYVHTDKALYMPGEILWFKPYVVHGETRQPLYESSVIYVELINNEGSAVLQAKVENKPGANGSLYIPQGISTGNYRFMAYTSGMKEQGLFFSRPLGVINPYAAKPAAVHPREVDFQLFPEGGTLLHGVSSKIAHKLTDHQGKGVEHALTVSKNGTPVTQSASNALGMGSFTFTPDANATYSIQATVNGRVVAGAALPTIEQKGVVLNVTPEADRYTVRIYATEKVPLTLQYASATGQPRSKEIRLDHEGKAEITLAKEDLVPGTSCIAVLNTDLAPINERVVFRPVSDTLRLQAELSPLTTGIRNEATLKVTGAADAGFSVAIRRHEPVHPNEEDIFTTLFLRKNVLGPIENARYYLSPACTEKDRDDLLLTQGWRKIVKSPVSEARYHQIRVKFTDKETHGPLVRQDALLSIAGENIRVFPARTDDAGIATFFVKNIYGPSQLAIKLVSDRPSHVEIISPFASPEMAVDYPLPGMEPREITLRAINSQAENSFFSQERAVFNASALADSIPFYGQADSRYILDDYTRFVLMEEVLREYVKEVWVRKSKDHYELRLLNPATNALFKESPLVLLDGIPLNDVNQVIRYDPLKVKKIEVLREAFVYGGVLYEGIVSFRTYKNILEDFKLDAATTLLNYDGLQYERVYYTPKYATPADRESRKPDTRTLLYWNPNAAPNEVLRFSTSDIRGKYTIDIQGIDNEGRPGRTTASLTID